MGKITTVLLLSLLFTFIGCGEEAPKTTKVPIPPIGQKPAGPAPAKAPSPPAMEIKAVAPPPAASYSYNPQGKPDPFHPLVVEKIGTPSPKKIGEQAARATGKPGTPLERMELSAFKLVAIIWDIPNPRGMVEDAGGKGYILTLGTRIGQSRGQVTKISSAGVVVTEKYESEGKIKTREIPLRLYAE